MNTYRKMNVFTGRIQSTNKTRDIGDRINIDKKKNICVMTLILKNLIG